MKKMIWILLCLLMAAGYGWSAEKSLSDEEMEEKLVGDWYTEYKAMGIKLWGTNTFTRDKRVVTKAVMKIVWKKKDVLVEGTWKIKDGHLLTTVTNSTLPKMAPVGSTARDVILKLDDKVYSYRDEDGVVTTDQRIPAVAE